MYCVPEGFRFGSLRALRPEDADGMLEWMHDSEIDCLFQQDFLHISKEQVDRFIQSSHESSESMHFAICGETDEYMGTISLKSINQPQGTAEYAIATRKCAHGTGVNAVATQQLFEYAFSDLGLNSVYLNVKPENKRAITFYEKMGFVSIAPLHVDEGVDLLWYSRSIG